MSWRRTTWCARRWGKHLFEHFLAAKREEWRDYIKHVSPWEVDWNSASY